MRRPVSAPERGEIWLVDLGLVAKVRPCLVVSIPAADSDRALATLIPHTTSCRGSRFEVVSSSRFLKAGAFDVQNIITIPHAKLIRRLGKWNATEMSAIESTLKLWLGLS